MIELACIECPATYPLNGYIYDGCPSCQGLLEVRYPTHHANLRQIFDQRLGSLVPKDQSGVWRFREALPCQDIQPTTFPEGRTNLYTRHRLSDWAGVESLWFKHEGENPTGSFKDRGMSVAVTQAKRLGVKRLACASTGNTSASLAAYAATAGLEAVVYVPKGKISAAKLAQAKAYGAQIIDVEGDFDVAMSSVRQAAARGEVYLVNSLNPFRIEGQKTIMWDLFQTLKWQAPDWIVVPAGNLGNTSAFGKAIEEAFAAGWISKRPRLLAVQAQGASPFYASFTQGFKSLVPVRAQTVASAIQIGDPVNYPKAWRAIQRTQGIVTSVSDAELLAAKTQLDRQGLGCEPASATTLAAVKNLRAQNVLQASDHVVCVLTGHFLKDPTTSSKAN